MTRKSTIIISQPYNFRRRTFKEVISEGDLDLKQYISKEWITLFKEAGVKKSQLKDPQVLLEIFTTIYGYMGNEDIEIFKNKPPHKQENSEEEEVCAICLDNIQEKESVWSCKSCHGILHHSCTLEWSQRTPDVYQWCCPLCRSEHNHVKSNDPVLYYQKTSPNRFTILNNNSSSSSSSSSPKSNSKFSKFRNSLIFKKK